LVALLGKAIRKGLVEAAIVAVHYESLKSYWERREAFYIPEPKADEVNLEGVPRNP
jgi:hypothetical protein